MSYCKALDDGKEHIFLLSTVVL